MNRIGQYLALLQQALAIGTEAYELVKDAIAPLAQKDLTPQEYAELEDRWHVDALRAAANAGVNVETGKPFGA